MKIIYFNSNLYNLLIDKVTIDKYKCSISNLVIKNDIDNLKFVLYDFIELIICSLSQALDNKNIMLSRLIISKDVNKYQIKNSQRLSSECIMSILRLCKKNKTLIMDDNELFDYNKTITFIIKMLNTIVIVNASNKL